MIHDSWAVGCGAVGSWLVARGGVMAYGVWRGVASEEGRGGRGPGARRALTELRNPKHERDVRCQMSENLISQQHS